MAIQINTKSWHYRLIDHLYTDPVPNNLCTYFWKLVFAMIGVPFMSAVVFILGTFVLLALVNPFVSYGVWLYYDVPHVVTFLGSAINGSDWHTAPMVVDDGIVSFVLWFFPSIVIWYMFLAILKTLFKKEINEFLGRFRSEVPAVNKSLGFFGLTVEFIRAKKKKFCPTLEFKD